MPFPLLIIPVASAAYKVGKITAKGIFVARLVFWALDMKELYDTHARSSDFDFDIEGAVFQGEEEAIKGRKYHKCEPTY